MSRKKPTRDELQAELDKQIRMNSAMLAWFNLDYRTQSRCAGPMYHNFVDHESGTRFAVRCLGFGGPSGGVVVIESERDGERYMYDPEYADQVIGRWHNEGPYFREAARALRNMQIAETEARS